MKYTMYRFTFPVGVHLGGNSLYDSRNTFSADTFFSALFMEALKQGADRAEKLLEKAKKGDILFSDAFPFVGEENYLPKPMLPVESSDDSGDSTVKKAFKSLQFIPMEKMDVYLKGNLDAKAENDTLKELGRSVLKTSASIAGEDETVPYHVGVYYFNSSCGLSVIVGTNNAEDEKWIYNLIKALSFSGIGGKRSAGYGRFKIESNKELDGSYFEKEGGYYMSLTSALPMDEEWPELLTDAKYQLRKRGGFIASDSYAQEQRKKKDMYLFGSGSCFTKRFSGDVYDVSDGGSHPVYRYAKPIFYAL